MKPTVFTLLLAAGLSMPCIAGAQMTSTTPAAQAASSTSSALNPRTLSSSQITQLQQCLKGEGYNVTADGVWGQSTVNALKKFQTAKGLPANGALTSETVAGLGVDLTPGSSTNTQNQSNNSAAVNNSLSPAAGGADNNTSSSTSNNSPPAGSANDNMTGGATSNTGTGSTSNTGTGSTPNTGSSGY